MKRYAVIAALAMGVSFPVLADDKPPGKSQPLYSPRLADIMVATQLRHFKLWYAGQVKNWPLANYELAQIRATFDDTTRLYPDIPAANMTTMADPADEVGSAIEAKDSGKFTKAFHRLTSALQKSAESSNFSFKAVTSSIPSFFAVGHLQP